MDPEYAVHHQAPAKIVFHTDPLTSDPWISISEEGFWVRGVKVEQGPDEAKEVYDAFCQWLAWSALNRQY